MMKRPTLVDPLKALQEDREAQGAGSAAQVAGARKKAAGGAPRASQGSQGSQTAPPEGKSYEDRIKQDFRLFLTLAWRYLLGVDPSPIQLDMAWWLQHGPDRAITMAFRGFSKSWITGLYALWRLYCDPDEKVLVVSGSKARSIATTNWCLELIMAWPLLARLKPKASNRSSGTMFDVGNCVPAQSASFMAAGIGGQLVGFRGTCIIPDDVETQQNSLTVTMREKIRDGVKEFESVLTPGGVIKWLGTPHDVDSLYLYLLRLRLPNGEYVYKARIWPARFPNSEEVKAYGDNLAPYILQELRKQGPVAVGKSTMPNRFPDDDLAKREAAIGRSEFRLQFMLDLSGNFEDLYPLKLRDLIVMPLDDALGPEEVLWGNEAIIKDLDVMGHDGDWYYAPGYVGPLRSKWEVLAGFLDPSGKGSDETSFSVIAYHYGRLFLLHQVNSKDGFGAETLKAIAKACIRFGIGKVYHESNFGGGAFGPLLQATLMAEWAEWVKKAPQRKDGVTGTMLEEVRSGTVNKEKRILAVLEPITQQHRLVVGHQVIKEDYASIMRMEGADSRHRYGLAYQYTHLTKERDCLGHDDRLESMANACAIFAERLGVDPIGLAFEAAQDRVEAALEAMFAEADLIAGIEPERFDNRPRAVQVQRR